MDGLLFTEIGSVYDGPQTNGLGSWKNWCIKLSTGLPSNCTFVAQPGSGDLFLCLLFMSFFNFLFRSLSNHFCSIKLLVGLLVVTIVTGHASHPRLRLSFHPPQLVQHWNFLEIIAEVIRLFEVFKPIWVHWVTHEKAGIGGSKISEIWEAFGHQSMQQRQKQHWQQHWQ
jgi:hypothetical protein